MSGGNQKYQNTTIPREIIYPGNLYENKKLFIENFLICIEGNRELKYQLFITFSKEYEEGLKSAVPHY